MKINVNPKLGLGWSSDGTCFRMDEEGTFVEVVGARVEPITPTRECMTTGVAVEWGASFHGRPRGRYNNRWKAVDAAIKSPPVQP